MIFDIGNNSILAASSLGQVGPEWQVAGVGGFYGTDTTDMILRNSNTGVFEVYDISNNQITFAAGMGQVGMEWTAAGFGDFSSRSGETDILMRGSNTGAFEVYDISHNVIRSAASMGQVGFQWQVGGIAADPPAAPFSAGSTAQLVQAMASFGASAAVNSAPAVS